jgi:hypothetical protein
MDHLHAWKQIQCTPKAMQFPNQTGLEQSSQLLAFWM